MRIKTTKAQIVERQRRIIEMIRTNQCSINCAAAIHANSPCFCKCYGSNHGALWIDEIVIDEIETDNV